MGICSGRYCPGILSPALDGAIAGGPAVAYAAVPLELEPSGSPSRRRPPARERRMGPSTSRRAGGATIVSGSRQAPRIANGDPPQFGCVRLKLRSTEPPDPDQGEGALSGAAAKPRTR